MASEGFCLSIEGTTTSFSATCSELSFSALDLASSSVSEGGGIWKGGRNSWVLSSLTPWRCVLWRCYLLSLGIILYLWVNLALQCAVV